MIDRLLSDSDDKTFAITSHSNSSNFCINDDIPSWICIEYMAQTISARVGLRAHSAGHAIPIGLLLGTRKFTSNFSSISREVPLVIAVDQQFGDMDSISVFRCEVYETDDYETYTPRPKGIYCAADLKVFRAEHPEQLLRREMLI